MEHSFWTNNHGVEDIVKELNGAGQSRPRRTRLRMGILALARETQVKPGSPLNGRSTSETIACCSHCGASSA
jgi:hypothetical protein